SFAGPGPTRKLPSNMRRIEPATPIADKSMPSKAAAKPASAPPAAAPSAPTLAKAPKAPDPKTPAAPDPAPAPKAAAPVLATATPAPAAVAKTDVPFYYELPFNVRKTLPPLHLSMHVYAGDPAQRF